MPTFSPSRRRVVAALALTSALLITLDLQGNSTVGAARRAFGAVFSPFEDAARVVSRPVENAWRGIRDYPDVAEENRQLKQDLAALEAERVQAAADLANAREIERVNGLDPSLGDVVIAKVVGNSPTNEDQTVTINKGSNDGLEIGQMVVVGESLVGKITSPLLPDRSTVMLVTDARFAVAVKVENLPDDLAPGADGESGDGGGADGGDAGAGSGDAVEGDGASTSSGAPGTTSTTVATTTTTTEPPVTTTTLPGGASPANPLEPITTAPPDQTTLPAAPARQSGTLEGRGGGRNPYVVRVSDSPRFGQIEIGAVVRTSGDTASLAPEDLLVGTVSKRIFRAGSGGDSFEVRPAVDVATLGYVAVLKYRPAG